MDSYLHQILCNYLTIYTILSQISIIFREIDSLRILFSLEVKLIFLRKPFTLSTRMFCVIPTSLRPSTSNMPLHVIFYCNWFVSFRFTIEHSAITYPLSNILLIGVKRGFFSSGWLGWIADLLMSILLQRSSVNYAGLLEPWNWRRYFAVKYRKSVTLLLSVNMLKTKIFDISVVDISNQIHFQYKLKTTKAYLSCCVAAFESTMLTSTASHAVLLWSTAEV
jgi:hypothetical protein